jgi:phosphatidylserine/phosphatidylglycerophosphate/cardiolipin synthase-like enzyme
VTFHPLRHRTGGHLKSNFYFVAVIQKLQKNRGFMVQILNTTGLNYHVEQTIANAEERIILISPYLKLSARIKELIEDKNRMKVDIRIIYGKSELNPKDHEWLVSLPYVRLSFCQNLHAKFYANESQSLICSLNLYDFSQINNHELGC